MVKKKRSSDDAIALYDQIAPILAGQPAAIQGTVLSMAMGAFISGHLALTSKGEKELEATKRLRSVMMTLLTQSAFAFCADIDGQSSMEAEDEHRPIKGSDRAKS